MFENRGHQVRQIILGCILSMTFTGTLFAAENVSGQARVVGQTFKALARAYVMTADVGQLKEKGVKKIEAMKEERFQRKYADIYKIIKELPTKIKLKYGITEKMTKAQTVRIVGTLDKKMLYDMIDNISDPVIAKEFDERMRADGRAPQTGDLLQRVSRAWEQIVSRISKNMASGK